MTDSTPCINHRTCQGYAVPPRVKCVECIEADENEKAEKAEKRLRSLEKKPRNVDDIWRVA